MDHVEITKDVLNLEDATHTISCPEAGAISVFIGTTRNHFNNRTVVRLEYEAYEPMAIQEMGKICELVREKWNVKHICIIHRIGVVPVCDASVIIAISSVHRSDAIQAVQFAIDTLKATVPIWKKEVYEDGGCSWKENAECCWNTTEKPSL